MTKRKGIAKKIVAGALALAVAAGGVSLLGYTSRDNDGNWFGGLHWADNKLNINNENGGAVISNGESSGMLLSATAIPLNAYEEYGITELAEKAFSLSVTYTPADTTYQATTYTISFVDGTDCSNFARIEQSEEGSLDAVLTVLQAFDKQIVVTATCDRNPEIKATTTVDYVGYFAGYLYDNVTDMETGIPVTTAFMGGSIYPELTNSITITLNIDSYTVNSMAEKGYTLSPVVMNATPEEKNSGTATIGTVTEVFMMAAGFTHSTPTTEEEKAYWQALSSVVLNGNDPSDYSGDTVFNYRVTSHRTYNGVTYNDINISLEDTSVYLNDWTGFEVEATGMSSNTGSIVTG